jgi:hypothetical protein
VSITVIPTKAFIRDLKRLGNVARQSSAREAVVLCQQNHKDQQLRFEAIRQRGYFTIRSTFGDRVLLHKISDGVYEAVAIGNHDYIYGTFFRRR